MTLRNWLLKPPYAAVPWLAFLYVVICCLLFRDNGPFSRELIGFDDNVRMASILEWVNGAGWYDRMITRVNEPDGFRTIWARLVDVPAAFVIVVAQKLVTQEKAALTASIIVPWVELILMFHAMRYFARPLVGRGASWLVIPLTLFTTVANNQMGTFSGFYIGEASHHAWYGILDVVLFGAVARMVLGLRRAVVPFAGSVGLLLAVGVEPLPIFAGMCLLLTALACVFRRDWLALLGSAGFGGGALVGLLLLPLHQPFDHWFILSLVEPSLLGPALAGSAAMFLFMTSGILRRYPDGEKALWLVSLLSIITASLLWYALPILHQGATGGLSQQEQILAAQEHVEVWSMWRVTNSWLRYIVCVAPSVIAVIGGLWMAVEAHGTRRRMLTLSYAGVAAIAGGIAQIYWRYIHYAQTTACPMFLALWLKLRGQPVVTSLVFAVLVPVMFLLPVVRDDVPFLQQILFFPARIYMPHYACDPLPISDYLNQHYDASTRLMTMDFESAAYLYHTHLRIDFLANFPSQDKFIDNKNFFLSTDAGQVKAIAAKHNFDLVAVCDRPEVEREAANAVLQRPLTMQERLAIGNPPPWLKPIKTGLDNNYKLYSVDHAALK